MADVYLAVTQGPGGFHKLLVVKLLRRALVKEPDFLAMFMDEARLAARLSHPNIVQTYEVGQDGGVYFIAMEYLDGQPLHHVLTRFSNMGGLPVLAHLRVLAELLNGLHHAHELRDYDGSLLQVVHRDITPQNVFLTYDGQVKLVDFGIAKAMDSVAETRVGLLKGKLPYMAPEQVRGEKVDRRADIFSAGVMLWEAVAGRRMWKGLGSDIEIAKRLAEGDIPSLPSGAHADNPQLRMIVEHALAPRVDERYPTAAAFHAELEDWIAFEGERVDPRAVGRLVANAFSEERASVRALIDAELGGNASTGRSSVSASPLGLVGELSSPGSASGYSAMRGSSSSQQVRSTVVEPYSGPDAPTAPYPAVPPRSRMPLILVAATLGVAGLTAASLRVAGLLRFDEASPALDQRQTGESSSSDEPALSSAGDPSSGSSVGSSTSSPDSAVSRPPRSSSRCGEGNKPVVELTGDIEDDTVLTCDRDYLLKFQTVVRRGATLTIEPGTTLRGDRDTKGLLLVQPGARLMAVGRADAPVVFTSELPEGERRAGDWGGVVILGNAPINLRDEHGQPKRGQVEGIMQGGEFGGEDADDDSGTLRYVRIEYSGIELGPNNEVNGLTLAGVGRRTKIDHVMVRSTSDDCFEFFGGTVDAKHLICDRPGDDAFDFDFGYAGRLQYLVAVDDSAHTEGGNGIEADNDPGGSDNTPRTAPRIYNATLCGPFVESTKEGFGILSRRGAKVFVSHSLIGGFDGGVDVRDKQSSIEVASTWFWGNLRYPLADQEQRGHTDGAHADDDFGYDELAVLRESGADNAAKDRLLQECLSTSSARLQPESELAIDAAHAPPDDGFFDAHAKYRGAFRDSKDRWDLGRWVSYGE